MFLLGSMFIWLVKLELAGAAQVVFGSICHAMGSILSHSPGPMSKSPHSPDAASAGVSSFPSPGIEGAGQRFAGDGLRPRWSHRGELKVSWLESGLAMGLLQNGSISGWLNPIWMFTKNCRVLTHSHLSAEAQKKGKAPEGGFL